MIRRTHHNGHFIPCLSICLALALSGQATASYAQSEVVIIEEADQATIDGGSIQQVEGFTYYEMQNTGFIEWTFEIANEGAYDLVLGTRLSAGTKGQHLSINGKRFKNQAFPENEDFVFDATLLGMDWANYRISPDKILASTDTSYAGPEVLTLAAGSHTMRIEPSQGSQQFSGFSLVDAATGDTAVTVIAPDAVAEEVVPMCDASDFCPTGFKSVALREGAFLTFNIFFPENGDYQVRFFYNAPDGGFSDLLLDWNVVVDDINFASDEGVLLTGLFEGEVGNRSLTVDTERGGFSIDYIELIKVQDNSSTANERDTPDEEFSLTQNYPNPFFASTTISYTLGSPSLVQVTVYDILGREVHVLENAIRSSGTHHVSWDGLDANGNRVASGIYFYRMETEAGIITRQMIYLPR